QEARYAGDLGPAPYVSHRGVRRDRAQAEEQGWIAGVPADPLDDHRRVEHEGVPAERQETARAERRVGVLEGRLTMATRMVIVDLGAWSVKLAIASPGIRGAAILSVVEKMVPPGPNPDPDNEPLEQRQRQALAALIEEQRLRDETGYIGVYGDQVFTHVLEFG